MIAIRKEVPAGEMLGMENDAGARDAKKSTS
jgi:hypothetical protein